jgi:deazaflavin-dependent oxidoreductase (nitroreductase family)
MAGEDGSRLFGAEHVRRYRETGGEVGHDWRGTSTLLLTTTGRRSGRPRETPLIYGTDGERYAVVASNGGSDEPPAWYRNLSEEPAVELQVGSERFEARARTATPEERARLWPVMTAEWPAYDDYQQRTTREIPIVVLERA